MIWTDVSFARAIETYPEYSRDRLCEETIRDGLENERMALSRAALVIYCTHYAAQEAIRFYNLDPAKVRVVAPGPAFHEADTINFEEAKQIVSARPKDRCRLLFVGMNWERKGGDIVVEVARRLNAAGLPTELVLVSAGLPDKPWPEFVRAFRYVDRAVLNQLCKTSHFMFVPTRAEALGLVFVEANAFALPSIASDVDGVPEVIRSGVNGATFPVSADPDQYCTYIKDVFANCTDHYSNWRFLPLTNSGLA